MSLVACDYELWMAQAHPAIADIADVGGTFAKAARCDRYGGVILFWWREGNQADLYVVGRMSISSYKDIPAMAQGLGFDSIMVYHWRSGVVRLSERLGFKRMGDIMVWESGR